MPGLRGAAAPTGRLLRPPADCSTACRWLVKDCAPAVAGICRVNPLLVAGPASRIPSVNRVLGPRPEPVGWRGSLHLTLLGSRAKDPAAGGWEGAWPGVA